MNDPERLKTLLKIMDGLTKEDFSEFLSEEEGFCQRLSGEREHIRYSPEPQCGCNAK